MKMNKIDDHQFKLKKFYYLKKEIKFAWNLFNLYFYINQWNYERFYIKTNMGSIK